MQSEVVYYVHYTAGRYRLKTPRGFYSRETAVELQRTLEAQGARFVSVVAGKDNTR